MNKSLQEPKASKPKESAYFCNICGKQGHSTNMCRHRNKHAYVKKTNKKGPKSIWVPRDKIIHVADLLNNRKKTEVLVLGQWMLTTHDGRKVYVPRPSI